LIKKILAVLLSVLVLASVLTGCGDKAANDQSDLRLGVSALTALADSHVYDYLDVLQALAILPQVQSADWDQMQVTLARPLQSRIGAKIFFILPDGSSFTSDQGKTSQNLADRDYFAKIMRGETVVGEILVGKISGIKSYLAAVPVLKDGKVVGGLGTTPYLDVLSQTLVKEIGLDSRRVFYALDSSGAVVLSSDPSQIMAENPTLLKDVVWQTSTLTGWRFALGQAIQK
jgi:C4-dicarboxylate-specific signal transduction histidine kinase